MQLTELYQLAYPAWNSVMKGEVRAVIVYLHYGRMSFTTIFDQINSQDKYVGRLVLTQKIFVAPGRETYAQQGILSSGALVVYSERPEPFAVAETAITFYGLDIQPRGCEAFA